MNFNNLHPIIDELDLESDRGLVLVAGAMLEKELEKHLTRRLLPQISKKDELLHRADFETKIILAYRVGLITEQEYKIYNQLRELRNKCAHEITHQTFDKDHFKHRIVNIIKLSPQIWNGLTQGKSVDEFVENLGWRKSFTLFFALIIMHKRDSIDRVPTVKSLSKT